MSSTDVLAERARLDEEIAGRTMIHALADTVAAYGDSPAYSDKHHVPEGESWRTLTWAQTRELALDVAAGLVELGVGVGDTVAIMATNRNEHFLADIGAVHAGATPMSIYNTLSTEQVAYVAGHAEPAVVVVENADHLTRWGKALDATGSIRAVVVLDADANPGGGRFRSWDELVAAGAAYRAAHGDELAARAAAVTPDSPATILYTSGTTGNPKGVVLTHRNVLFEAIGSQEAAGLVDPMTGISYLPLAHIAERILGLYGPQIQGSHMHSIGDPSQLLAALGEVHPTGFFGVPRVWEKIKTGLSAKLAADPNPDNVTMVQNAMAAGLAWVEAQEVGREMTPEIEAAYQAAEEQILGLLKLLLGLDQVTWAGSAAAPMPLDVAKFMAGLGIKVFDVYGMTETCGAITANGPGGFKLGTVGRATPGMEVKLAEDGEVLVRGPVTTPGYHLQEDATRALIDEDGWVHTGDIGTLDEDGFFAIVDRKKELIITSQGKNIAPSNIENLLKESPIIGHAMAIGDGRPYVVAILTLDGEIAPLVAEQLGLEFTDLADLAQKPEIVAIAQAAVDAANERLSRPEQVKSFELLGVEWTAESEELTPTLKLKRRVVNTKYSDVLDRLYG
ncbi:MULTISPECIES: AMP-dependent synthetase/ligase [unclassified Nocardioides]|uniref:AMP-dependent synthetase/ligase n=1 Tax=unclassified Nocardioides TaxID=2615069 RepID=UPI0009F0876C|nr:MULTISPECIES: AMP-dependent synthetase/ligase [unclassified Nocardioides]GAW52041.1 AMP-dependent synthetase and ligase [Nocardioides sp. PD653-B2]GAW55231.1 AMP-dependent synthetase and ligase [Nocardioides sp. PD653]